jgi:hypothetical protein
MNDSGPSLLQSFAAGSLWLDPDGVHWETTAERRQRIRAFLAAIDDPEFGDDMDGQWVVGGPPLAPGQTNQTGTKTTAQAAHCRATITSVRMGVDVRARTDVKQCSAIGLQH